MIRYLFFFLFSIPISAQTVYKTPSGEKYHLGNCRTVKNVSSKMPLEKALQKGLMPCKICRPPFKTTSGFISKEKKTSGINSTNQCFARTKKGSRCKRNTKIGNNYCFQHGSN